MYILTLIKTLCYVLKLGDKVFFLVYRLFYQKFNVGGQNKKINFAIFLFLILQCNTWPFLDTKYLGIINRKKISQMI